MLDLLLIPVADLMPDLREAFEGGPCDLTPCDLTPEEVRELSGWLDRHVRVSTALVEYTVALCGKPRGN